MLLWKPGGLRLNSDPFLLPEHKIKGPKSGVETDKVKVREQNKVVNGRWRRGSRWWAKTSRTEIKVSELLGSLVSLRLVMRQTSLFGMKTGRAVCTSQAFGLKKNSFFQPICTFILSFIPLPNITPSISHYHKPPQQTLLNSPDGCSGKRSSSNILLNQREASSLLSYFIYRHHFTDVSIKTQHNATLGWCEGHRKDGWIRLGALGHGPENHFSQKLSFGVARPHINLTDQCDLKKAKAKMEEN